MTFVRTSELFGRVGQVSSIGLDHASVINKSAEDKNAALSTAAAHYYKENNNNNKANSTNNSQTALWFRSLIKTDGLNTQSQPHLCTSADWLFMGGNAAPVSQRWSHPGPPHCLQTSPNPNIDKNASSPGWEERHLL